MRAVLSLLSSLSILVATGAAAQQTTGDIQGRVVAPSGQPVADAQISVTSPSLQGDRKTVSDARGRFVVPSLPAGSYAVAIRRIGYGPMRIVDVAVRLGTTNSLGDIRLEAHAVELPEVVVSGAKPVIDPVSSASGVTLDSSQFLSLPSDRSFRSLLTFAPQANASFYGDGVNIGGSTGFENAYYVDGMNIAVGAGSSMELPFNFVREIQVATGGYEAEFGRALSGVINVVTPSGGNEFHGQALGFFTSDELRTSPRVGPEEANPLNFRQHDIGLSLSGPIRRDRLWYSVAYDPTFAEQDLSLARMSTQRDAQVHHLLAAKLSWRASVGTDVTLTLLGDHYHHDSVAAIPNVLPATTDPNAVLARQTGGGTTVGVQVRHQIDPRTEVGVSVSRLDRSWDVNPRSGSASLSALTWIGDYTTNASLGGFGQADKSREIRTAIRAALTLLRGAHTVKFGAEYEDNAFSDTNAISLIYRVAPDTFFWAVLFDSVRVHNRVPTLYAQDAWVVNPRLRVSAGLRWEAQYMSGSVGPPRTIARELAPRLGVVYQLGELGSQRVFAGGGRFFEQIPSQAMIPWNGAGSALTREYGQNPLVDSSNGVVLIQQQSFIAPATADLIGQAYDQLSIGYERRLGAAFKVGTRASYRVLRWVVEDGFAPGDSVYRMGNPGRGPLAAMPRARQRYAALELSIERSTPGALYLLASYVLSRNVGNYTGVYPTDYMFATSNNGPQYDYPDLMTNAYGLLPNDRTHVAKAAATYRFGYGVTLGAFLSVASGTPLSEYGTSAAGPPYQTFVRPRGSAGRTPAIWSLDLHAAYKPTIGREGRVQPSLLLDLFNVGSPRKALLYDQLHYTDSGRTSTNPNYGSITRHQPPMSARVGMVVDF